MGSQSYLIMSFISPTNLLGQRTYSVSLTGWAAEEGTPCPSSHMEGEQGSSSSSQPQWVGGYLAAPVVPSFMGVPCHTADQLSLLKASSLWKTSGFRWLWAQQSILEIHCDTTRFPALWFAFCLRWIPDTVHLRMGGYHTLKASLQVIRDSQKCQHKDTGQQTDVWKFQHLHWWTCLILPLNPSPRSIAMPDPPAKASLGYRNVMEESSLTRP